MKTLSLLLVLCIALSSCSPKIKSNLVTNNAQPLDSNTEVLIIKQQETIPEKSVLVGDLKIGDTGFSTDCGYTKVVEDAKETARKSGANLIFLTEVKEPNFGSSCYRIKAKMYRNLDAEVLADLSKKAFEANKSRLPADADYAVIYFYRPKSSYGSLIGYKVKLDEEGEIIGRVRNGEKFEYKTQDFGKHTFWGETESKTSVILDVKPGQEYFVRCGITMGVAVGKPEMYLIENETGIKEYENSKFKSE